MVRKKRATISRTPISLPLKAFRVSMLSGSLEAESPGAGADNIPPNSQPPTPVSLCAGVDYLTLMYESGPDIEAEMEAWESLLEVKFNMMERVLREKDFGTWTMVPGSCGSSFEYRYRADHSVTYRINGGGQVFGHLSELALQRCYKYHRSRAGSRCTRIDLKLDDTQGLLSLSSIGECLRSGDYKGYSAGEILESIGGKSAGKSVYFGGRKSVQRVRFYDKKAEAGLDYECIRQEVQCRAGRAEEVYTYIFSKEGKLWDRLASRVTSSITFGLRRGKNLNRMVVADFWQRWVGFVGATIITPPSLPRLSSVSRTLDWMARSVARAIAKSAEVFTPAGFADFINILYRKGQRGLKELDWKEIEQWRHDNGEAEFLRGINDKIGILN